MAFHQILAGIVTRMLGTTTKLSIAFQILGLWLHLKEIVFFSFCVTVTILYLRLTSKKPIETRK